MYLGPPVLASLLQPSWELLNTFDKLLLLSRGEIVYWGPVSDGRSTTYIEHEQAFEEKTKKTTKKKQKKTTTTNKQKNDT